MTNNYYTSDSINCLLEPLFIETAAADLNNFLQNSSTNQQTKLQQFFGSNLLQYILIFLQKGKHLGYFPYALNNVCSSDFNKYDGNCGTDLSKNRTTTDIDRDVEIDLINSLPEEEDVNAHLFLNTLKQLESYKNDITSSFMIYKKHAAILQHQHNPNTLALHILLEDVVDGELTVTVNKETRTVKNRGDYVLFETMQPHCAYFSGTIGKFISFGFPKDTFAF